MKGVWVRDARTSRWVRVAPRSLVNTTTPRCTAGQVLLPRTVTWAADDQPVLQPMGIVHGGVYATMAEGMVSEATFNAVYPEGNIAVGMSNQTSFLRPITGGTIHAEARRRHRGRTTWVWEVDITDDEGRVCALVRMTVAVRQP